MKSICSLILLLLLLTFQLEAQTEPLVLDKEVQFSEHEWIPFYNWKKSGNTTIFQGNKEKKNYFEGWYFKLVGEDGSSVMSIIPGIALSEDGEEQHAFIQIIDGQTAATSYHRFSIEDFYFSKKEFAFRIGQNVFSKDKVVLNIKDGEIEVKGTVQIFNITDYSDRKIGKRKIMGWYRRVPFMQCYHGVVSLTHDLSGKLMVNGKEHRFDQGKGYIEKDWGSGMPSSWIWMQSNHFENDSTSFMLSIANVPFVGKAFDGFLGFLYLNGEVYRFATYRHSKLNLEVVDDNRVKIEIKNRKHTFLIEAQRNSMGMLQAPVGGSMDRRIPESIDAEIKIVVLDKKGHEIYSDQSSITGLEMVGDYWGLGGELK